MTLCLEQSELIKNDFTLGLFTPAPNPRKTTFFYGLDLKQNRLFHISSAIKEVLGYSPKEAMQNGLKWFVEQIHPDDIKQLDHLVDQQFDSPIVPSIHYRFKNKCGLFCRLSEYRCLLHDSNGTPSFLIGQIENA